jgi:hypothetical protein
MATLLVVKHLTRKRDYLFSFDLQDGFYALGINQVESDSFMVNVREHSTDSHVYLWDVPIPDLLEQGDPNLRQLPKLAGPITAISNTRRLHEDLPKANKMARRANSTLRRRLPIVHICKGGDAHFPGTTVHPPRQPWPHSPSNQGLMAISASRPPHGNRRKHNANYFYTLKNKLTKIAQQARELIGRATRNAPWLPVRDL